MSVIDVGKTHKNVYKHKHTLLPRFDKLVWTSDKFVSSGFQRNRPLLILHILPYFAINACFYVFLNKCIFYHIQLYLDSCIFLCIRFSLFLGVQNNTDIVELNPRSMWV